MKTIKATRDKHTEEVKKFCDKKIRDNNCQKKKDGSKSSNKEKNQSGCEPLNLEKGSFGALEPAVPNYMAKFCPENS